MSRKRCGPILFWLAIAVSAAPAQGPVAPVKGEEASHLHVLLVLDTNDQMGATWGRDGENLEALLETAFRRQQLDGRYTITRLTGSDVTPENILAHYRDLRVGPQDALLFYYSGHGGFHIKKGHFLALHAGKLYRSDLLAATAAPQPRLRVILTDCCANYAGGAFVGEPAHVLVAALTGEPSGARSAALQQEPPQMKEYALVPAAERRAPPRPTNALALLHERKARQEEPAVADEVSLKLTRPLNLTKARREEPPLAATQARSGGSPRSLATHLGAAALADLVEASDGEILRHLFFRHAGTVDVNGCAQGDFSFGTLDWGGSLFTNTLIALQKNKPPDYDANRNRVAEWSEFFPRLRQATTEAGLRVSRGKIHQAPQATKLGVAVLP